MIAANILSPNEARAEAIGRAETAACADLSAAVLRCDIDRDVNTPAWRTASSPAWDIVSEWLGDGTTESMNQRMRAIVLVLAKAGHASDLDIRSSARAILAEVAEWHGEQQAEAIVQRDESEAADDAIDGGAPVVSWGPVAPAEYMDLADRRAAA